MWAAREGNIEVVKTLLDAGANVNDEKPGDGTTVLLLAVLAMEQWRDQLPLWLQRLAERPSWFWNTGIGLIIGLSLLRWLLQR